MIALQSVVSKWPNIDREAVISLLKQTDRSRYPELDGYTREQIYRGIQGEGGLFLASDMAQSMRLRPGIRVLDLACGAGETAV